MIVAAITEIKNPHQPRTPTVAVGENIITPHLIQYRR